MSAIKSKDKTVKRKNVQVAVRIRPLSDIERSGCNKNIVSCDRVARTVSLKNANSSDSSRFGQGQKCFGPYDKIFGPESTQIEVYDGVLAPLMGQVLDGYNCTVFAYGQTGSGKTFTMEGRHDSSEDFAWNTDPTAGIIPRALDQIFSVLGEDTDYTVRVSYVELYNEQIFDLLNLRSQLESLRIFDDKTKGVSIAGAEEVIVRSPKEVHGLLRRGAEKRRTATTLMNMTSSRSHSVFTVSVMIREPGLVNGEELLRQGKLNLVDLAGSENIGRSGATDIRAREAGNINTSLLALGRVINALTMGASHIPYRESKLTRILQDSLGGKTITTIIATISPASSNFEESVNTLDYAQRAKNIKNNPEVNQRITRRGLLKEYNDEIDRLRRDLLAAREKHGIYLDKENYDEMIESIDEKKAKVEELETQLEGKLRQVQILLEDFAVMDQHYKSIYEKFRSALTKLESRKEEIEELSLEIAQTKDNYNAASQALSVSCDSFVRLRSQAIKLQTYSNGLYSQNGLLFNKIDEVLTTFDGNYQKLKGLFDGQCKQFEIGRNQLTSFTSKSEIQLNEAKTAVCALKEMSDQFEQNIEKFTQEFRDRMNQELDSLKNVATEHKNEFGKAIHNTLSTINKQVNDCASHSSEMSQLFDNTTQKMENFVEKEFVQIQSSGKTPERKIGKFTEVLINLPEAEKLFEEQKGFITPKKNVNYKRRDSFLDSSFVSSLVSPDTLKCNLQATTMVSTTKTGRLEPVDEEKKNECAFILSMDSLLEVQRTCHEERERCVDLMVREYLVEKKTQREKINSDQRVKGLIDRCRNATDKLIKIYNDESGERAKEIQAIGGPNEFAEFYSRLKSLKDIHRKNPNETARPLTIEFQEMANFVQDPDKIEREMVRFTDEEGYGKFLDMHTLYEQYVNLKGVKRIDYITFISTFNQLHEISKDKTKKTGAYKNYVSSLEGYLTDFLRRAKPLIDIEAELYNADNEFETKWKEGKVPGWSTEKSTGSLLAKQPMASADLDLAKYETVDELMELGSDRLKSALLERNLKCGGSLKERAQRLLDFKNADQNGSAATNGAFKAIKNGVDKEEKRKYELAKHEVHVLKLTELVRPEISATLENIERKQARGVGEEEEEDDVEEFYEVEEEETDVPYNPKNLPLDWDGKPIPYWLYKLHGLNIGYSCEICGNQVYKGPKAFQRHFTEWRHSHGMRCLGIPNTAHFTNITKINDAIELWKKICEDRSRNKWNPDLDEEFEDSLGNVVNRRMFEDLKRQGLL